MKTNSPQNTKYIELNSNFVKEFYLFKQSRDFHKLNDYTYAWYKRQIFLPKDETS